MNCFRSEIDGSSACAICANIASRVQNWKRFVKGNSGARDGETEFTWKAYLKSAEAYLTCRRVSDLLQQHNAGRGIDLNLGIIVTSSTHANLVIKFSGIQKEQFFWNDIPDDSPQGISMIPRRKDCPTMPHFMDEENEIINFKTIRQWIHECDSKHRGICDRLPLKGARVECPSILIDLKMDCLTKHTKPVKYTCLSYVWGHSKDPFRATTKNIDNLLKPGSLKQHKKDIPPTIRDAMTVTKALSIQYLWVDRLCILQDDQDALNHEISKMSSIYACSTFTIIAGSGPNDQHGIPGVVSPRNISHTAVRFNSSWLFAFDDPEWHEGRDIWHTRAWTFQERLVPQRCLVFYKNSVKWECGRHSRHELFEKGGSIRDKHLGIKSRPWPDVRQYTNLVRAYTSRQLSFQNDAMNAFSAVLHTLEPSFPGGFTFGLPDFLFDQFLTWRPGLRQVQRVNFLSWSWLGWQGNMEPGWMSADWEPTLMWAPRYRYISRSMIKWQKEDRTTLAKVTIESTASKWLLFKGHWYLNDELPDGWEEVPGSINTYRHKTLSNSELGLEEGDHLYHPVPIRSCVEDSKPIDLLRWSPILRGRALVSKLVIGDLFVQSKLDGNNPFHTTGLFIKTKPITGPTTSEPVCFDLLDTGFNWCGMILANDLAPEAHARELPAKSWPFQRAQSKAARKVKKDGKEELYRKELEM